MSDDLTQQPKPIHLGKLPIDAGQATVNLAAGITNGALSGMQSFLESSFQWSIQQLKQLQAPPAVASLIEQSINKLDQTAKQTESTLNQAISSTSNAMQASRQALDTAFQAIQSSIFENVAVSSIVGESFADVITTSEIRPSFRLNGKDVSIDEVADQSSENTDLILCVPGLFCDETMWHRFWADSNLKLQFLYVRFNPGAHISDNGKALLSMIKQLLDCPKFKGRKLNVITYSQGGLILRSALYQSAQKGESYWQRLNKVIFISSPDGGSYIEKLGFWLGMAAESMPVWAVQLIGKIGNQRSDAMKDLSHGIIREEDWQNIDHPDRYGKQLYFGELDNVDAYQIYSIIANDDSSLSSWIGDGVVEKSSLTKLSNVFQSKQTAGSGMSR
ncbi:MAG: alpha/beta hydrolase [Leptonema sp. (in: Bacteria)]|nr:alpha/beta hydrolase [Leptonema sp. (in: bacteria)]